MITAQIFLVIAVAFLSGFTIAIFWIVLDEEKNRKKVEKKTNPGETWEKLFEPEK